MNVSSPNAPLDGLIVPPAPQLIRQGVNQNALMPPNQPVDAGPLFVFNPNPHAPTTQHAGLRRKTHRR
jgi:hypothetical protein